ncbi:MAG: hypothetical protein CMG46_02600 [Candidatus Marinimicrobia bacterium]|nr:hypothetical protein [Candidatus Neomarinimicrobiota bacterium]|tara:strand:+ start:182 stop:1126 length:945 start_codon:yes stop_codon:yes gene_type:complete
MEEELFEYLDTYNKDNISECNRLCCDNIMNHVLHNNIINCNQCNSIISNIIELPEWRNYGDNNSIDDNRCGMPLNELLPDSSTGSTIKQHYKSSNKSMNQVIRYQQWNSMTYKERSIYKVFTELSTIGKSNNLSNKVINESKALYKIISETKISRGSNRKGIIAASIYFACKNCGYPRSPKEISNMFKIDNKILTKGIKNFQEILQLSNNNNKRITEAKSINAEDFIDRFCDTFCEILPKDIDIIKLISNRCISLKIDRENTPPSIAAGSIYLYCRYNNIDITKKDLSNICRISEVTINKCYKSLEPYVEYLMS